jgi:hypothetical protein
MNIPLTSKILNLVIFLFLIGCAGNTEYKPLSESELDKLSRDIYYEVLEPTVKVWNLYITKDEDKSNFYMNKIEKLLDKIEKETKERLGAKNASAIRKSLMKRIEKTVSEN